MESNTDAQRLIVPGVAGLYAAISPYSYTLIRVALGLILIPHGFNKLFLNDAVPTARNFVNFGWSNPLVWAYFIGSIEFFGGLLIALGLFTRIAAAAVVIQMTVISFVILWPNWFWGQRGMEFALLKDIVALAIYFRGGGRYSLDHLIGKEF